MADAGTELRDVAEVDRDTADFLARQITDDLVRSGCDARLRQHVIEGTILRFLRLRGEDGGPAVPEFGREARKTTALATCATCGGPVVEKGRAIWLHDNAGGFYAGREVTHDPDPVDREEL